MKTRQFIDALKYARSSSISSKKDWLEYNNHPNDVPNDPEKHYKTEWKGWKYFLGKVRNRVELAVADANTSFYILVMTHFHADPGNIVYLNQKHTIDDCYEFLQDDTDIELVGAYRIPTADKTCNTIIDRWCSRQEGNRYIVGNMNELLFNLSDYETIDLRQ